MSGWQAAVAATLGLPPDTRPAPIGASAWATTWAIGDGAARRFVKVGRGAHASMLAAEADGLAALQATATVRVPRVIAHGAADDGAGGTAWLVLEWLDLVAPGDGQALGAALAALHRAPAPRGAPGECYGWHRDNFIGATPQCNAWCDDWGAFFRERRLRRQIERAATAGHHEIAREADRLLAAVDALLRDHRPVPSLLHGDLWSGNAASLPDGTPVVFDPAVYVGDRECDLAMTELFGGFGGRFHAAYRAAWPVPAEYAVRREVYNLYHLLNHLNLFGAAYAAQCTRAARRLLATAR